MTDQSEQPTIPDIPEAVSEPKRRFSIQLVWIIPILAALIGLSLAAKAYLERGEIITITFNTGEGMEAGKTKIKYKDVEIGEVKGLALSQDRSHVIVTAEISKNAKGLLVKDTRFWVVRARISGGNVSGLGTLLGGTYIGVDAGSSQESREDFTGLEAPPPVSLNMPGRYFVLHAPEVGSLDPGAPIFFRKIQVGQVTSTELDRDGNGVTIKTFVRAPYDSYVRTNTVFWQASGVDVTVNTSGIKVNTESMAAMLLGGLAFQSPDGTTYPQAPPNAGFVLYGTRDEALKHAEPTQAFLLMFREPVRGLSVGAPVDLRGVTVGEVTKISITLDPKRTSFAIPVEVVLFPERLRALRNGSKDVEFHALMDDLVAHGLRADIRNGSLLTGQLYIGLDFNQKAKSARIDWNTKIPTFPTVPGSMQELQRKLMHIVEKIESLPMEEIAGDARKTLKNLDDTVKSADKLLNSVNGSMPEVRGVLGDARQSLDELRKTLGEARKSLDGANRTLAPDAPLQVDLRDTLREVSRAAQSLRVLGEYLEQHPESIIRGKKEDVK
ncbi:MlaD family protein [Geomonas sp. Red32]|uniref:PqiB family protein n=1 Tax=Geomonas sp. Red32 TaxID=2912856 RepID=UPI00202D03E2|nr:MlaD family protein [Geomonas sp. Red32]MCM0083149.1 MlaD family protein [Geomonas sp. Red32]